MKKVLAPALLTVVLSGTAVASDNHAVKNIYNKLDTLGWNQSVEVSVDAMNAPLQAMFPGSGLTLVSIENPRGKNIFAVDPSGSFLMSPSEGQVLTEKGMVSLQAVMAKLAIASSTTEWPAHALPEGTTKAGDLYVFTDPTCGYCKKLDQEVDRYLENGVQIHYIPFPRSGVKNTSLPGFSTWAASFCDSEPAVAYRDYNLGRKDIPVDITITPECEAAVTAGHEMGVTLGVTGTPFLYYQDTNDNITTKGGYLPAGVMLEQLGVKQSKPDTSTPGQ